MFGFKPKLPIDDELRQWADEGFLRLEQILGRQRMLQCQVILPEDRFFPDVFDGTKAGVAAMAERVAGYMGVLRDSFVVEIFAEDEERWRESLPEWNGKSSDAAGLYFPRPEGERFLVGVHAKKLKEPVSLVATLAHELAHVLLLGGGLMDHDAIDMEPMTDLATVFLGMGVFTSSAAFQFKQWTEGNMQGWNSSRQGYLPEPVWAYALARFAQLRGEERPPWAKALPKNIHGYFAQSARWLKAQ
jgi:hypothetical protein